MSTPLRRDPRTMFPDLVEWFEEPFMTLRPYLAQPIRVKDYIEGDAEAEHQEQSPPSSHDPGGIVSQIAI